MTTQKQPGNPTRPVPITGGMDRVIEKTRWQRARKPVTWGIGALSAILLVLVFGPEEGRALKIKNDRIDVAVERAIDLLG